MATKYLSTFKKMMPQNQRRELERIVKGLVDRGELRTRGDKRAFIEKLLAKIDPSNKPTFKIRLAEQYSTTNPDDYNAMMDEALIDLTVLYQESALTESAIWTHESINKDFVKDTQEQIRRLKGKIEAFKVAASSKDGYDQVFFESFTDPQFLKLGSDLDIENGVLSLKGRATHLWNTKAAGIERISIVRYPKENERGGITYIRPARHDLELNYTSSKTNRHPPGVMLASRTSAGYWAETCLSDAITQTIDDTAYEGVVLLVRIFYYAAKPINKIVIDPFTEHTLIIPRIRYREGYRTDTEDTEGWKQLTKMNVDGYEVPVKGEGKDIIILDGFDTVAAKALEIMINQPHSGSVRYSIPASVDRHNTWWDEMQKGIYDRQQSAYSDNNLGGVRPDMTPDTTTSELTKTISGMSMRKDKMLKSFLDHMGIGTEDVDTSLTPEDVTGLKKSVASTADKDIINPDTIEVIKQEYTYGTYSIKPMYVEHEDDNTTFYSHDPAFGFGYDTLRGALSEMMLETEQEIPGIGSIQFYLDPFQDAFIAASGNIPIVPKDTTTIQEPVTDGKVVSTTLTMSTEFPADTTVMTPLLYADGVEAASMASNTAAAGANGYGDKMTFTVGSEVEAATHLVVKYHVAYDTTILNGRRRPDRIDLTTDLPALTRTEKRETGLNISGRNIVLKYYPLVDMTTYNWDVSWGTSPIVVKVNGVTATDRTNYLESEQDAMDAFNIDNYQYFLEGDTIYMNVDFGATPHDQASVEVTYKHLCKYVIIRGMLQSNHPKAIDAPRLDSYTVKFRARGI